MGLSVLSTQVIKTGLKTVFAEPRPFTVYLAEKQKALRMLLSSRSFRACEISG